MAFGTALVRRVADGRARVAEIAGCAIALYLPLLAIFPSGAGGALRAVFKP